MWGAVMGTALKIGNDRSADELRRLARREPGGHAASRLYAIANALERMGRAEAARPAGMERQALWDALCGIMPRDCRACTIGRRGGRRAA